MKKLLITISLTFICTFSFSQIDTTAIIQRSDSLYAKGVEYYNDGKYKEAIPLFQESYNIDSTIFGSDDPRIDYLITWISNSYYKSGDIDSARAISYDYMIPPEDRRINTETDSLSEIAEAYANLGDWENNLKLRIEIADKIKSKYGHNSFNYGDILNVLGMSYRLIGDYGMALQTLEQALTIMNDIFSPLPPYCQQIKTNMASIYIEIGDIENAYKYYSEALDIYSSTYGNKSEEYAQTLKGIGDVNYISGDYNSALKKYQEVANIYLETEGDTSFHYAYINNSIGLIYENLSDFANAKKRYSESLKTIKYIFGEDHYYCASLLSNLASSETSLGEYDNALDHLSEALDIMDRNLGSNAIQCITIYNNIANVYSYKSETKDQEKATEYQEKSIEYLGKALQLSEYNYGKNHRSYIQILTNIGSIYSFLGRYAEAEKYYIEAMSAEKNILKRNFSVMTLDERQHYWETHNLIYELVICLNYYLPTDTISPRYSYDAELVTKGLLLSSEIEFNNLIAESKNKKLISDYEDLKQLGQLLNSELEKPIEERYFNCDSIANEMEKREKHIVSSCKQFGDFTKSIAINWKDIQNSMKSNDVAIEFTNFTENDTTRYIALVLTKNMDAPVCIPLFEKSEMQKLQRGVALEKIERQEPEKDENRGAIMATAKKQGIYESTGLYNMIWKPMEKYFPKNPRIYFAPSGMLHQIAVEYAPIDKEKTISDKYEIYRVSSTRYLAMDYMPKPMKTSTLYGGIYYDSDTTTMKKESLRYSTRSAEPQSFSALNQGETREGLSYLPGTKTEVENIVGKLKKKKVKTSLVEGSAANEESFKALSGSDISCLHIATHGFFLQSDEKLSGDNSLVQSGLLLSGANQAWTNKPLPEGVEDGILTAKEISFMDLRKTDLVVLSACQTALGEINSEGVFGLQRGFKKAGVRTIIMSLWPVDDNATLLMMTEFYSNMTKGMSKREAFLAAQNKVKTTPGFENPRFWAAFIMLDGNE